LLTKIKDNLEGYIQTKVEIVKLDIEEKLMSLMFKFTKLILFFTIVSLAFFFLSIGLAQWLNSYFESRSIGYFILAIFYILLALLLYVLKDKDKLLVDYFVSKSNIEK
jgi:hypothetical protein